MHRDNKALLLGLAAVLLWSTVATAFKLALAELDIFQLLFYGVLSSALSLLLMVLVQGKRGLLWQYGRHHLLFFLAMGLLNPVVYYLVLFRAYDLLPAQQAQPINYTWAITMALLAVPLLGQRLSGRDILAALMCYVGVLVIATRGDLLHVRFDSIEGVFWALFSTVIWAVYWLANTRASHDPVAGLCLSFLLAVPLAGMLCVIYSDPLEVSGRGLAAAAYVGLIEMGITFALWASALKMTSSVARVGNLIFVSPLLSLVFIASVLGEQIEPATLVGLALIIPALWIQQSQGPAQQARS